MMKKITRLLDVVSANITTETQRWQLLTRMNIILTISTVTYGVAFYAITQEPLVLVPNLIEAALFGCIIIINKQGLHHLAGHLTVAVSNLTIIYYSGLLGNTVEVHLLAIFFIGFAYSLFKDAKHILISLSITTVAWLLCEINYFYEIIPPLGMSRTNLFISRWLALPFILFLDIFIISLHIHVLLQKLQKKTTQFAESSHELRNMLQTILSIVEKEKKAGNKAEYIDAIYSAALYSKQMINKELEASKFEAGKEDMVNMRPVEIKPLLAGLIAQYRFLAAEQNVTITYQSKLPACIITDQPAVIKIISNILSNAIKFSPAFATVSVRIFKQDAYWRIHVKDHGSGIPAGQLNRIFDPYFSVGGNKEGTGLGLHITRRLVESLKGTIDVNSSPEGTEVAVALPLEVGHMTPPPVPAWERYQFHNKKILIIEDNLLFLALQCQQLRAAHADVTSAVDAHEGLALARKIMPDVIVLDMSTTPDLTGVEVIRKIKTDKLLAPIPIIAQSGDVFEESAEKALAAGASSYLVKPVAHETLVSTIRDILLERGINV